MATTERDYYELLGVSRDASDAEIKKAFRGLARELHPDVSDAPDAQERFREIVEAYEVLSKSETRELYDRYGHAGLRGGGFQPGHFDFGSLSDLFSAFFGDDLLGGRGGRGRGADLVSAVEIELVEAARGVTREVPFEVAVQCAHCSGDGAEPGTEVTTCPTCGDEGLEFGAGTQRGEIVQLRGRGMPVLQGYGRGDHRVLVNVVVPRHLSDEQRRLLEEFDSHADERTYKPDEGLFEKLKSAFR